MNFVTDTPSLTVQRYKMTNWLSRGRDKFWLILNYSKVVWDIDTKFSPVVVLMSFQLSTKFEGHNSLKKTAMPLGSSKWKWAWRAHFLSHTYETQEICCFLADVKIILLSFFDLSYCLKVAKNAEAFLSRCSELLDLPYKSCAPKIWLSQKLNIISDANVWLLSFLVYLFQSKNWIG